MKNIWDGIYGQNSVKEILENLLDNKMKPQALIFSGQEGVGKDYLAVRFSHLLNKIDISNSSIQDLNKFSAPHIKFIFAIPRGKNENSQDSPFDKISNKEFQEIQKQINLKSENPYYKLKIDKANEIRLNSINDINKFLSLKNVEYSYRIILISQADLMNDESQNALLKNLEEPAENTIFILTTNNIFNLKETIRSRCWQIDFEPLSKNEIAEILITYFNKEKNLSEDVSNFSFGNIQTALFLIDNDFSKLKEKLIVFLRNSMAGNFYTSFREIESIKNIDFNELLKILLTLIILWLNDVVKERYEFKIFFFHEYEETFKKFNLNYSHIDLVEVVQYFNQLCNSINYIKFNPNILLLNIIYKIYSIIN